jgi:hypothetical protein
MRESVAARLVGHSWTFGGSRLKGAALSFILSLSSLRSGERRLAAAVH